jgi:hypothetical protein
MFCFRTKPNNNLLRLFVYGIHTLELLASFFRNILIIVDRVNPIERLHKSYPYKARQVSFSASPLEALPN